MTVAQKASEIMRHRRGEGVTRGPPRSASIEQFIGPSLDSRLFFAGRNPGGVGEESQALSGRDWRVAKPPQATSLPHNERSGNILRRRPCTGAERRERRMKMLCLAVTLILPLAA